MEMLQRTLQTASGDPTPSDPDAGATLAACRRMADAGDAAIDQVYSGDAETFLAANKQAGGQ